MTRIVIGIDVGGEKKGFHAVSLENGRFAAKTQSASVSEMAAWCKASAATIVAIDAPCRWRTPAGSPRLAETQMAAQGIACYYAPTETRARTHAFYSWMLPGMALFEKLAVDFPLILNRHAAATDTRMIETFPHAVSCALAGEVVSAKSKSKKAIRRELLSRAGIAPESLSSLDEIDAALCAIAADHFALGEFTAYGEADQGGLVVVPRLRQEPLITKAPAPSLQQSTALATILRLLPALTPLEQQLLASHLADGDVSRVGRR